MRRMLLALAVSVLAPAASAADFDQYRAEDVLSEINCDQILAILGDASAPDGERPFERVALMGLLVGFTYATTGLDDYRDAIEQRVSAIRSACKLRPDAFLYEILAE